MASETASKRLKPSPPLIGTHNGHFHADEALAVYLLRLLPTYTNSPLLRTRDPALLATCHTVVDVGGEYNPSTHRYDHHQRTFNATFPSRATKLSSAGLVYLHFGKAIIARRTRRDEGAAEVGVLWDKVYEEFVEALDAQDNGISVYDPEDTKGLTKRFHDGGVGLGSLVGDLNDSWGEGEGEEGEDGGSGGDGANKEEKIKSPEQIQQEEDARFLEASTLMGTVFLRKLNYYHRAWLPARSHVQEVYAARKTHEPKGRIMVFDRGVPWKDHLYTIEADYPTDEKVLYVLYPEDPRPESKWRIQAVGVSQGSFESRRALPQAWRGLRDEALDGVAGIAGCVFVHASGFIGGNRSFDGAMRMALQAVA